MRRKPVEKLEIQEPEAKAKAALVLEVLSGEKSISEACRQTGLKPMQYYKLEGRMVEAMVMAAKLPAQRGRRRNPVEEAGMLAEKTQEMRQEHRRMQSLLRVTRKLLRPKPRKMRGPNRLGKDAPKDAATGGNADKE